MRKLNRSPWRFSKIERRRLKSMPLKLLNRSSRPSDRKRWKRQKHCLSRSLQSRRLKQRKRLRPSLSRSSRLED